MSPPLWFQAFVLVPLFFVTYHYLYIIWQREDGIIGSQSFMAGAGRLWVWQSLNQVFRSGLLVMMSDCHTRAGPERDFKCCWLSRWLMTISSDRHRSVFPRAREQLALPVSPPLLSEAPSSVGLVLVGLLISSSGARSPLATTTVFSASSRARNLPYCLSAIPRVSAQPRWLKRRQARSDSCCTWTFYYSIWIGRPARWRHLYLLITQCLVYYSAHAIYAYRFIYILVHATGYTEIEHRECTNQSRIHRERASLMYATKPGWFYRPLQKTKWYNRTEQWFRRLPNSWYVFRYICTNRRQKVVCNP